MTVDPVPMQSIFVITATSLQNTPGQCNIQNERNKHKKRAPTTRPEVHYLEIAFESFTGLAVPLGTRICFGTDLLFTAVPLFLLCRRR